MKLNNPLITSFEYENKIYDIDLAFDNVLDVFDVLNDNILRDNEKIDICLELLLDLSIESNPIELWNYIYKEFIEVKRKQPIEYDRKGNPMPVKEESEDNVMDLKQDAEHIYASFIQAYG